MLRRLAVLLAFACACGCASTAGMSGPTMSGRIDDRSEEAPAIQSNDILARELATTRAEVKHILIGWKDLAPNYGGRPLAASTLARSRAEADALASQLLARARAGEPFEALMREYSEDQGSAKTGSSYTVTLDASLVFEFKRLAMRLNVGEIGLVKSSFGWHIMKRIE